VDFLTEPLDDRSAVIRPRGRLNMVAAPRLRALINETVESGRPTLVVDLSETEFMDSSGLGALVAGLKTARQAGGDLRVAAPTAQVEMVFQLTRLDRVLRPYPTVEGAVGAA
jgi:anti-sigma B factor antagonist